MWTRCASRSQVSSPQGRARWDGPGGPAVSWRSTSAPTASPRSTRSSAGSGAAPPIPSTTPGGAAGGTQGTRHWPVRRACCSRSRARSTRSASTREPASSGSRGEPGGCPPAGATSPGTRVPPPRSRSRRAWTRLPTARSDSPPRSPPRAGHGTRSRGWRARASGRGERSSPGGGSPAEQPKPAARRSRSAWTRWPSSFRAMCGCSSGPPS